MIFECTHGALNCIAEMHLRQDELVLSLPHIFNDRFVLVADLVVNNLEVHSMVSCGETMHD